MERDTLQDFGWTWTMTSGLHVTTVDQPRFGLGSVPDLNSLFRFVRWRAAPTYLKKKKQVEEQTSK